MIWLPMRIWLTDITIYGKICDSPLVSAYPMNHMINFPLDQVRLRHQIWPCGTDTGYHTVDIFVVMFLIYPILPAYLCSNPI